jgi:hypothetical protein
MTQTKCVSGCKGLETEICDKAPRCSYANGEKRQFCRLSRTFKMGRGDCTVRRKTNKAQKVLAIQNFMKNTTSKRRSEFLKAICSDSGFCYALGKNRTKIFDFFDGFVGFEYVKPPIVAIGNPSSNGFVKSIQYERHGYTANAVLKSSTKSTADNLAYEFLVGMFLNKMGNQFPCFVQTYGLYYYKTNNAWVHARDTKRITANIMEASLELHVSLGKFKQDITKVIDDDACAFSKYAAVLIQHFPNVTTFGDYMDNMSRYGVDWCNFSIKELPYILYQIYMPLAAMSKVFTHYDLHQNNVLLYEPVHGKYIQYYYHHEKEIVKFKSKFIAKIIDYGRAFYKNTEVKNVSATDVLKRTCVVDECNLVDEECGDQSGFRYLTNTLKPSTYYMSSSEHNPSADLRLLHLIKKSFSKHGFNVGNGDCGPGDLEEEAFESIDKILDKIIYGVGLHPDQKKYGTKPMASGLPGSVQTVNDVEQLLRDGLLTNLALKAFNDSYYDNMEKICDIHIYSDGRNMRVKM